MNISGDAHPSVIFPGVKFRLAIFIFSDIPYSKGLFSTSFTRWYAEARENLFYCLSNVKVDSEITGRIPKISSTNHQSILDKIFQKKSSVGLYSGGCSTYYHNVPVFWIRAHSFVPYFCSERDGEKASTQLKQLYLSTEEQAVAASGLLCSSLFYLWWITASDCYHLNKKEIDCFPVNLKDIDFIDNILQIVKKLEKDMLNNSRRRIYHYKTSGRVEYDEFYLKLSKPIMDKIDQVLAKHYGFTEEELDFIINYDIKYRMGLGSASADEDS
jgi:hypothetical protein